MKKNLLTTISIILIIIQSYDAFSQVMGQSLDFATNGNSYVQLTGDNDFGKVSNFQENFSFEAWVNPEGSKTWSRVFDFGDSTNDYIIFTTKASNGQCLFEYRTGGAVKHRLYGGVFPTSGWSHVAVTFSANGDAKLYLNGNLMNSANWPTKINFIFGTTKNYLGKSQFPHDPNFEGKLDEVRVWKSVRTQAEIQQWMNCELPAHDPNLMAYFNMNQGLSTGPSTNDNTINNLGVLSTGKGVLRNFALVGSNGNWVNDTPMPNTGPVNNCLELDGTDGFKLANKYRHDFTEAYTVEYWFKPNSLPGLRMIISKGDAYQNNLDYYMDYDGNNIFLGQNSPSKGLSYVSGFNAITPDQWQHVAGVTYENNGGIINELYINGVLIASQFHPNRSLTQNNYEVRLGRANNQLSGNVNGRISNLRLWNKRLRASEVTQNMSTNYPQNTAGLVSQYNTFDNIDQGLIDNVGFSGGVFLNTPQFGHDPCLVRFIDEPQDQTISVGGGETITFTADVEYCDSDEYSYQWQKDGAELVGETNLILSLYNVSGADQGVYTLNVTACNNQVFTTRRARLLGDNPGTVLSFDGKDDYMEFAAESLVSLNQLSIEAWVRFDEIPHNQSIMLLTNEQGVESYYTSQIRVNKEGKIEHSTLDDGTGNMKTVVHPEVLVRDQWYHINAYTTGGMIGIKIDGVDSPEQRALGDIAAGGKFLVGHEACGFDYFHGDISEIRIWNDARNTYNQPELTVAGSELMHYYNFTKGVSEADNSALTTDLQDPLGTGGHLAQLYNFDLEGLTSNWTGCGQFSSSALGQNTAQILKDFGESTVFNPFGVAITGEEAFQWYKNQIPLKDKTIQFLEIDDLRPEDSGSYNVTMTSAGQCVSVSNSRDLIVEGSGEVLNFDGIDDHVIINTSPKAETVIMLWIKLEGDSTLQNIIQGTSDLGPTATATNQIFTDQEGNVCIYHSPDGTMNFPISKSNVKLHTNEWYHLSLRLNHINAEKQLFINGAEIQLTGGHNQVNIWNGQSNYHIGSQGMANIDGNLTQLNAFRGEMDDVRIYDQQITENEISQSYSFELFSEAATICGCTPTIPLHYLQLNQGYANSDNTNSDLQIIPDFRSSSSVDLNSVKAYNFSWSGDESNWSDCSPVVSREAVIEKSINNVLFQGLTQELTAIPNTSPDLLTYQWRKDSLPIQEANQQSFSIENFTNQDSGYYDVIIADQCSPVNTDTIQGVYYQGDNCFDNIAVTDTIEYLTSATYVGYTSDSLEADMSFRLFFNIDVGYCDTEQEYIGASVIYRLDITDPTVVSLDLHNIDADVDMFVLGPCSVDECYGSSTNDGLADEHIDADLQTPGTYFVIIDTKSITVGNTTDNPDINVAGTSTYSLDVEFFDGKCYAAEPFSCGSTITANTSTGTPFVTNPCGMDGYTGNEKIYEITVDTSSTISAFMTNMSADLDLFLLDSLCFDMICKASSTNADGEPEQIIQGVSAGTYYLVVDGVDGAEGSFELTIECNEYFEVSQDDNDAYIDLDWSIDKSLCVPQDTGVIIRILTTPNTILYEEEFTTAAATPDIIEGTFRHYVGTDHDRLYILRVINRLSNKKICDLLQMGSTTAFQKPEIIDISNATDPDSIRLTWRNHSKLSDQFRIYREGQLIANLTDGYTDDSLLVSFVDVHNINDTTSIQQDSSYEYCIETYSTQLNQAYMDTCATGSTYDINFTASNLAFPDKVSLNWADVSPFCDKIKVERNGIFLRILPKEATIFMDMEPIHGLPTEYSLTLMQSDIEIMEVFSQGSVAPNGLIRGKITTEQGDFPINQVNVILSEITDNGSTVLQTIQTDFNGEYQFDNIIYGFSREFQVAVNKTGSSFSPADKNVTLNEAIFEMDNVNFEDILPITVTEDPTLIDDFTSTIRTAEDYVSLDWSYTYDAGDTLFFNLYRNGNLILSTSDVGGAVDTHDDFGGAPDSTYQYILQVHNNENGSIFTQELSQLITYPSLTPLANMDIIQGDANASEDIRFFDPSISLDWNNYNHPSQNFSGFRIFRDGVQVGEVSENDSKFGHIVPPGSTGEYQVKAFKILNGIVYESEPYPTNPVSITANELWAPRIGFVTGRNIETDISDFPVGAPNEGSGFPDDFYVNAKYDGVFIERKLQSEDDSTYIRLGDLKASYIGGISETGGFGINPIFRDIYGVPNADYTYRLSTYLDIDGVIYTKGSSIDIQCPAIEGPTNLVAVEEEGKVALSWTSNQSGTVGVQSVGYFNYEGYELERTSLLYNETELITTLDGNIESYNDFLSNPLYDIFFDTYNDIDYNYQLKAYLDIDGVRYYAPALNVVAGPTPGATDEPLPTNFTASNDLPNHVKLCWEWTAAKQSEFVIFRDSTLVAILPYTARSFYDYDVMPGIPAAYIIQSRFQGNFSQEVRTEGMIPSFATISGRVYNIHTGEGLAGVNVDYSNQSGNFTINGEMVNIPFDTYKQAVQTDATGRYLFTGVPNITGLKFLVDATRINTDFNQSPTVSSSFDTELLTLDGTGDYVIDYIDYTESEETDELAQVISAIAETDAVNMKVNIFWSVDNMNYDGFRVYRDDNVIGDFVGDHGFSFSDSTGFPGIHFPYGVQAFQNTETGRVYSEVTSTSAIFPAVPPVVNLTVTAFTAKNMMKIAWSHPLDNHDWYTISRNGIYMDNVMAGDPLMWYDSTGVPGINYNYEVIAVNGNFVSEARAASANFKGVGEAEDLIAITYDHLEACPGVSNTVNYVDVRWTYMTGAADGFEIYRDDELIAEVDSVTLRFGNEPLMIGDTIFNREGQGAYRDYTGVPGVTYTYKVLPYINRMGDRYTSGIEELPLLDDATFPQIAKPDNLSIGVNDVLGSVQITFTYEADVVKGFEIIRDGQVLNTLFANNSTEYIYQDINGSPGQNYEYAVRVYDVIDGTPYYSGNGCEASLTYPIVPVPQVFAATQGDFTNHINVTWEFDLNAFVDSFYLENITLNQTFTFANGSRLHRDIVNDNNFNEFEYRIRASRIYEGAEIYSEWSETIEGWASKQKTGNEDNQINGSCYGNLSGFSVDVDDEWAISGTPDGDENIIFYRMIDGGFSQFQIIESPFVDSNTDFGRSVAIHGDYAAVGAQLANKVLIYHFDGVQWGSPQLITKSGANLFGFSVDIYNGQLIVSAPFTNFGDHSGEIVIYELQSGVWELTHDFNTGNTDRLGYGVAISDDLALVSFHWVSDNAEGIAYIEKSNGVWGSTTYPTETQYTETNYLIEDNIDLNGNILIIGDQVHDGGKGRILVADVSTGNPTNVTTFAPSGLQGFSNFGKSVAVSVIPSPDQDRTYLAVGHPRLGTANTSEVGKSYLIEKIGSSYTILEEYQNVYETVEEETSERGGWSVGLSQTTMMIGTPWSGVISHGEVDFHNLLKAPVEVDATDGVSVNLDASRVTIDWTFDGNKDLLKGFNIYRDDEFLIYRDKAQTTEVGNTFIGQWEDNTGGAGQRYVYSVRSVNDNIPFESYSTSNEGYKLANGKIQGSVTTAGNNVAVPGVTITATGIVDGEVYTYQGTTFNNGEYILDNVYYDHDDDVATEYIVTAEFFDHIINPTGDGIATLNSLVDPTVGTVSFVDETAYVIFGKVERPMVSCATEGVEVIPVINGTPDLLSQTTTDADGNYAIVVNPNDPSLQSIAIRIGNEFVDDMDTLYYGFATDSDTLFTDFIGFPFATEINYVDTLKYPIEIKVKNTCDDPISVTKWDVRIRTLDGCFDEVYQTNTNGDLEIDLLPLNYEMSIVASSIPSTVNQLALDYFSNFPVTLNLLDLHRDSINILTREEISDRAASRFTFHVAPDITVSGFTNLLCDTEVAVLQQGEEYTLGFEITEQFGNQNCSVTEGKVRILNPASDQSGSVEIPFDKFLEQFGTYTFSAGAPNQVSPHFYTITFDYLSDDDVFLGRVQHLVFVEGLIGLPGAGIITDPVDGNNSVPLPIMVLRDPPGDGSSSYISGGQSVSYETQMTKEFGGQTEISVGIELGLFGANTEFGFTNVLGGSDENTNTYTNTLTLSQTISTFDPVDIMDETLTGVTADIVVGQGLVMSYGKVYDYRIDCDRITVTEKNNISPGAASTTWHYTVNQIRDIITGFENDSIKIQNGTLLLTEGDRTIDRDQSLEKIGTYLANWRQVLLFHGRETVPMYNLCTTVPPITGGYPLAGAEIAKWKADVCSDLGTGINGSFVLDDDISWNDPLMDKYSAAVLAIRNLSSESQNSAVLWNHTTNYQYINNLAASQGQINAYGQVVENLTVGGGIAIERSINNVSASSRSHTSNFHTTNSISAAAGIDDEVTIVGGGFAGTGVGVFVGGFTGVLETSSVIKKKVGFTGTFEFKKSNAYTDAIENTVETGYTLSDDDSVDAFSVTVIQPIAQNHTPYFQFFGGFTSCPAEEGALAVDNPKMGIIQGGGTTDELLIQNVAEDEVVNLQLVIENQTPISNEPSREVKVYLDPTSNTNGAFLTLNGVDLNNGEFVATLEAFDPTILSLTIERGPLFYEYENLKLIIEPTCDGSINDEVDISVFFNSPCSPVTLVAPIQDWLINDYETPLIVAMQDYDPYNEVLEKAILEYRRIGSGEGWDLVNNTQILEGNEIPADTLAAYNEGLDATIQNPKYFFIWSIPENFIDGEYEVRVRMKCDFSNTYSNVSRGRLARNEIGLLGTPKPSDGVWTAGDEISFNFNLLLDCSYIQGPTDFIDSFVHIIDLDTGLDVPFSLSCFGNKLEFVLTQPMSTYDGHFLKMMVDEVPSITGNISAEHEWTFRVITQEVYWANGDTIKLRMYEDEEANITASLINTSGVPIGPTLTFEAADGGFGNWLSIIDPSIQPFDLSPAGRDVIFHIDAGAVGLGMYNETVNVGGLVGNPPRLHIQLEVLNRPPNWVVDVNEYSESMNLIANWKFDDQALADISTDSTDIISVWIDSEIRGVANIISADGFHYAFISVNGNAEDMDRALEFRIWDGDPGTEYDGHVLPGILYEKDTQIGTVGNPIIFDVNAQDDLARYIPLNGGGWTGFSLFTETDNMTLQHKLRSLRYETEGDIILTGDQFAQYNDSIGWYSFGDEALTELTTSDGYMIYLQGQADTLRVTGAIAMGDNISLENGWNWIGFPFEMSENVNLSFNYPLANGLDILKKDNPLPGVMAQTANYNPANASWQGNLPNMEPNNLYKLFVSNPNPSELDWLINGIDGNGNNTNGPSGSNTADPDDHTTWSPAHLNTDAVMPIIARVIRNGNVATDASDLVAFFEGNTLRGYAAPVYLPEFDEYQFSILTEEGIGNYDIRYYDAVLDSVFTSTNVIGYIPEGIGTFDQPYDILFEENGCPSLLIIGSDPSVFGTSGIIEARQEIRVIGNPIIPAGVQIILSAPKVTIVNELNTGVGAQVIVRPDGCE